MLSPLRALFGRLFRDPADAPARALYAVAVAQARDPGFYLRRSVPDTIDGRYELVVLHVFLLLRRLKQQGPDAHQLGRRLMEVMVDDFDAAMRQMGIGDTGIARRVKEMARGFAGRLKAYDDALDAALNGDDEPLDATLDNNLYGTAPDVPPAARAAVLAYVRRETAALAVRPLEELLAGRAAFGPVCEVSEKV
jgi:cytochrome b pre-mRNA-processing protein 3